MHPVEIGDLSVAMLTAKFLRLRFTVLRPLTECLRYDLVIDRGNGFERIQCKTGRIRGGAVVFNACSKTNTDKAVRRHYKGQIESFAVYCPDNDQCYLVPVDDVGIQQGKLRLTPAKNRQARGIRLAEKYLL